MSQANSAEANTSVTQQQEQANAAATPSSSSAETTAVAPTAAAASSSSSASARPLTTVIRGVTLNDETGEEEEFTVEAIPLAQLSDNQTDKLQSLASKVLKYFEQEAEGEKAEAAAAAANPPAAASAAAPSASFAEVFGSLALTPASSSKPPSAQ